MTNPITDGEGLFFKRSHKVERTEEAVEAERRTILIQYGVLLALQYGVYAATYFSAPGFLVPFLNHPVARVLISGVFFWQMGVCALHWYLAPITKLNRIVVRVFVVLFAIIPGILLPMLGPACIAILGAFGPIMTAK